MSEIRVNDIIGEDGSGAVNFSKGIHISSGVVTATTFKGNFDGDGSSLTGIASTDNIITGTAATFTSGIDVVGAAVTIHNKGIDVAGIITATGGFSGNATSATVASGLTGSPNIVVGNITASGTVQYEDVVNVDSAGIGTFKGGLDVVGSAVTIHSKGVDVTGVITATSFVGDGGSLTGVISGVEVKESGTTIGSGITAINWSGPTVTATTALGIATVTVSTAGIATAAHVKTNGQTASLNLNTAQDHKVTASGSVHITTINGSEGGSHTLRIINNGTATIGFSTNFIWASGSPPAMPSSDGAISLISFTAHKVGVGTQLLAGASLNYN